MPGRQRVQIRGSSGRRRIAGESAPVDEQGLCVRRPRKQVLIGYLLRGSERCLGLGAGLLITPRKDRGAQPRESVSGRRQRLTQIVKVVLIHRRSEERAELAG